MYINEEFDSINLNNNNATLLANNSQLIKELKESNDIQLNRYIVSKLQNYTNCNHLNEMIKNKNLNTILNDFTSSFYTEEQAVVMKLLNSYLSTRSEERRVGKEC